FSPKKFFEFQIVSRLRRAVVRVSTTRVSGWDQGVTLDTVFRSSTHPLTRMVLTPVPALDRLWPVGSHSAPGQLLHRFCRDNAAKRSLLIRLCGDAAPRAHEDAARFD